MSDRIFFDKSGNPKKCVLCKKSGVVSREGALACKDLGAVNPQPTESCGFDPIFSAEEIKDIEVSSPNEVVGIIPFVDFSTKEGTELFKKLRM